MSSRFRSGPAAGAARRRRWVVIQSVIVFAAVWIAVAPARLIGQSRSGKTYDETLDTYVRDGLVYYRALKAERGRFDAYVATLASVSIASAPPDEQVAFWLNAYNAIVLQTVVDHYPIVQRTTLYPPHSVRQIPGAFERIQHRVAGRMVTLDQ